MGLSRSKPKPTKGEEEQQEGPGSVPRLKPKRMKKQSPQAGLADGLPPGVETAERPRPPSSREEKPGPGTRSSGTPATAPQIVVTRASDESAGSCGSAGREREQRTIREQPAWGLYRRHRSPSTIAAYLPDPQ